MTIGRVGTTILVLAILIAAAAGALFFFNFYTTTPLVDDSGAPIPILGTEFPEAQTPPPQVTVIHHSNKSGVNTYSGSLALSSSCDSLGSGIQTVGVNPPRVTLMLDVIPGGSCPSGGGSQQSFSISIHSAAAIPVFDGLLINGIVASSSVIED